MEQLQEQVSFMIRTKDKTKYLIKRESKYGSSINLSEDKSRVLELHYLDDARRYVRDFVTGKKKISYNDLEIVKAKKIVIIDDYNTYNPLPETIYMCSSGFGYTLSQQEDYDKYENCLGPTLDTAKGKLTREKITEWLYILYQNKNGEPKVKSFDYELKVNDSYPNLYVDITLTNIVWE